MTYARPEFTPPGRRAVHRYVAIASVTLLALGACAPTTELDADLEDTDENESEKSAKLSSYAPCGTPLAEVDGVWAYSNGDDTTTGDSCAGSTAVGALAYQCVELAQRYFATVFGTAALWPVSAANEMCDAGKHPAGTSVHWVGDGYSPRRGDAVVWTKNPWGHVAIVASSWDGGMDVVEQNNSANGIRTLYGSPSGGWDSGPACFVTAGGTTPPSTPSAPPPAPGAGADCAGLGYAGACYGDVALWSEDTSCFVRDCASEGKSCGYISSSVGYGCLGGNYGSTAFDCEALGYAGGCFSGTLVWTDADACNAFDCGAAGMGCGWDGGNGYNCL